MICKNPVNGGSTAEDGGGGGGGLDQETLSQEIGTNILKFQERNDQMYESENNLGEFSDIGSSSSYFCDIAEDANGDVMALVASSSIAELRIKYLGVEQTISSLAGNPVSSGSYAPRLFHISGTRFVAVWFYQQHILWREIDGGVLGTEYEHDFGGDYTTTTVWSDSTGQLIGDKIYIGGGLQNTVLGDTDQALKVVEIDYELNTATIYDHTVPLTDTDKDIDTLSHIRSFKKEDDSEIYYMYSSWGSPGYVNYFKFNTTTKLFDTWLVSISAGSTNGQQRFNAAYENGEIFVFQGRGGAFPYGVKKFDIATEAFVSSADYYGEYNIGTGFSTYGGFQPLFDVRSNLIISGNYIYAPAIVYKRRMQDDPMDYSWQHGFARIRKSDGAVSPYFFMLNDIRWNDAESTAKGDAAGGQNGFVVKVIGDTMYHGFNVQIGGASTNYDLRYGNVVIPVTNLAYPTHYDYELIIGNTEKGKIYQTSGSNKACEINRYSSNTGTSAKYYVWEGVDRYGTIRRVLLDDGASPTYTVGDRSIYAQGGYTTIDDIEIADSANANTYAKEILDLCTTAAHIAESSNFSTTGQGIYQESKGSHANHISWSGWNNSNSGERKILQTAEGATKTETGYMLSSGKLKIKVFSQGTEPIAGTDLGVDELAVWDDTTGTDKHLIINDVGTIKKLLFT